MQQCADKKVIRDTDLELDELKPKVAKQSSTKSANKKVDKSADSSPISRKCLIYRDGQIEQHKDIAKDSANHN